MSFKIGDRVRVIHGPRAGAETEIVAGPQFHWQVAECYRELFIEEWGRHIDLDSEGVYGLNLPSRLEIGARAGAPARWLRHLRDGDEKGEWTEDLRRLCSPKSRKEART